MGGSSLLYSLVGGWELPTTQSTGVGGSFILKSIGVGGRGGVGCLLGWVGGVGWGVYWGGGVGGAGGGVSTGGGGRGGVSTGVSWWADDP